MLAHIFCVTISIRIALVFQSSACLHKNEEFSLCGWKCPPTCVNLRLLAKSEQLCPLRWECSVGCRCSAGYIKDEYSKNCVYVHNCPACIYYGRNNDRGLHLHLGITMVVIWVCICAAILTLASSAPIAEDGEQESGYTNVDNSHMDYMRGKRLNNNVFAITPCAAAAAAAANLPVPRSQEAYANLVPAEASYYAPSAYDYATSGYAGNMYRMEDPYRDTREMLRFSDTNFMEQIPAARFAYRNAPATYMPIHSGMASLNDQYKPAATGPAYGIFPNANTGTCSVPLLFSCSPSVVTGQMVKPETHVYGSTPLSPGIVSPLSHPDGYRGVDDHMQRNHGNQEQSTYDTSVNKIAGHSNDKLT
ncbi:uncharacterized protein LOC120624274 [Pararge aegeria]|nr:uncharacterized protein LOC120624274 [Pararge aegeria]